MPPTPGMKLYAKFRTMLKDCSRHTISVNRNEDDDNNDDDGNNDDGNNNANSNNGH